jgi:hypothetical protein
MANWSGRKQLQKMQQFNPKGGEVTRDVEFFNLDAIVGYRVNSIRGTQFRIWATHTLRITSRLVGAGCGGLPLGAMRWSPPHLR